MGRWAGGEPGLLWACASWAWVLASAGDALWACFLSLKLSVVRCSGAPQEGGGQMGGTVGRSRGSPSPTWAAQFYSVINIQFHPKILFEESWRPFLIQQNKTWPSVPEENLSKIFGPDDSSFPTSSGILWDSERWYLLFYCPPVGLDGKESSCNAGDPGSIPGSGRSPGEGNGSPLQYSCLENPMDGGAWRAAAHGVTSSQTGPRD